MEDHIHPQRNFRLSNNFRRSSTCQFPPPTEINNPNLPENFYDLVAELDQLTLSTPAPHGGQFLDHKNLTASQQPYSAFPGGGGSSGGSTVLGRIGSINGGGGGSTNYGPFVDSGHIPIPSSSLRYGDLQRMRVESAVRGQQMAAMYMQLHGYANPIEEANFRGFNFHPLNSNAAAQAFNLHGLNSNTRELENLYSLYNGGGGGGNQSLVRAGDGGSGFNGFHEFMINPSNPIMRTNGINRFDANRIRSRSNNNFSAEYENHRSRQSNYNFTSLEELKGRIYLVAKDQNGCRFLQKIVEEGKPEEFQMIYSEIKEHVKELMVDSFGNYLIQKMFELCSAEQITQLLLMVIKEDRSLMELCSNPHGTRAMQKLLEYLSTAEQRSFLISVLVRVTVPLTKCTTGNHVIQHCLKCLPIEDTKHILNVVADNCLEIATDKSGCCVLQQCVAHAKGEPQIRLLAEIVANALVLSEHPYGNYVVQFIVSLKMPQVTADILEQLAGNYVSLSTNKYGSNVVEKCMKESSEDQAMQIIDEIIRSKSFLAVLQDAYGNYVAQSAYAIAKGPIRQAMVNLIQMHYSYLHSHPHGKRVLAKTRGGGGGAGKLRV